MNLTPIFDSNPKSSSKSKSVVAGLLVTIITTGCASEHTDKKKLDLGVAPEPNILAGSSAYQGTIGQLTNYEGLRSMRVRGYGLVAGLGKDGSRTCPRRVREQLVQSFLKRTDYWSARVGDSLVSPGTIIDALDTAVVAVEGEIPACAVRGSLFDVVVKVLPGTETISLRGGRLYSTNLQVYRAVSETGSVTGRTLGRAVGPIFLNPFSDSKSATQSSLLRGTIISGGVVAEDRRLRLLLTEESYVRSRQIQDRINAQFPGNQPVADAMSPTLVILSIPEEYTDDTAHFLSLVRGLYLSQNPTFEATTARKLAQEITQPGAPHAVIAAAMEGLGRSALPVLDDLYTHSLDFVSFYAAAAGLRLGDHVAGDAMSMHAEDVLCPFRYQAIRALSRALGMAGVTSTLRNLLDNEDPRIVIAAYEALLSRRDYTIRSRPVGDRNFHFDRVDTNGANLIYVKRTRSRRIVLFGRDLKVVPPVFYRAPDGSITIQADAEDHMLTLLRVVVATGSLSPPANVPLELAAMIELLGSRAGTDHAGEVMGLGVDYGAVARALQQLCTDHSINAKFIFEQPNATELFGPAKPTGRPESEL